MVRVLNWRWLSTVKARKMAANSSVPPMKNMRVCRFVITYSSDEKFQRFESEPGRDQTVMALQLAITRHTEYRTDVAISARITQKAIRP